MRRYAFMRRYVSFSHDRDSYTASYFSMSGWLIGVLVDRCCCYLVSLFVSLLDWHWLCRSCLVSHLVSLLDRHWLYRCCLVSLLVSLLHRRWLYRCCLVSLLVSPCLSGVGFTAATVSPC